MLQILDRVELDAALAQEGKRAARITSTGVVIKDDPVHALCLAQATPWMGSDGGSGGISVRAVGSRKEESDA